MPPRSKELVLGRWEENVSSSLGKGDGASLGPSRNLLRFACYTWLAIQLISLEFKPERPNMKIFLFLSHLIYGLFARFIKFSGTGNFDLETFRSRKWEATA